MANQKHAAEKTTRVDGTLLISKTAKKIQCLNVGGQLFTTSIETLTKCPSVMLDNMFAQESRPPGGKDGEGNYFIDRDGSHFKYILNFLRSGKFYLPKDFTDFEQLRAETEFYGLEEMRKSLDIYEQTRNAKETMWIYITEPHINIPDIPNKLLVFCISNTFYSIPFCDVMKTSFTGEGYQNGKFHESVNKYTKMDPVTINVTGRTLLFFDTIAKRGFSCKGIKPNGKMIYEREL